MPSSMNSEPISDKSAPKEIYWTVKADDLSTLENASFTQRDRDVLYDEPIASLPEFTGLANGEEPSRYDPNNNDALVPENSFNDEFVEETKRGPFCFPSSRRTLYIYFVAILCGPILAVFLIGLPLCLIRIRRENQLFGSDIVTVQPDPSIFNTLDGFDDLNATASSLGSTESSLDQVESSTQEPTNQPTDTPSLRMANPTSPLTSYGEDISSNSAISRPEWINQSNNATVEYAADPAIDLPPQVAFPEFRFQPWHKIGRQTQDIAAVLGYDEHSWNRPGGNPIESVTYSRIIEQYPKDFQRAIDQLGFSSSTWDCWINHYIGYNWVELKQKGVALYFETLGWTRTGWESKDIESWETYKRSLWHTLTEEKRMAAVQICYTQKLWDGISIGRWEEIETAMEDFIRLSSGF